jgi:hypothetical protein
VYVVLGHPSQSSSGPSVGKGNRHPSVVFSVVLEPLDQGLSFSSFSLCFYGGFLVTPKRCLMKYL